MTDNYKDEITEGENNDRDEDKKNQMRFCTLCRRPESQTGKLIDLPNNIHICSVAALIIPICSICPA